MSDVLELRHGAEVAGAELVGLLVLLALERQQLADPLLVVGARVDERRVGGDRALDHPEDVDAAGERVGHRLEDEGGALGAVDVDVEVLLRRRRDALDEQVERRGRPEVLRRDTAGDREDLAARHCVLERVRNLLVRELLAVEVPLHQALVGLDDGVEQLLAVLRDLVGHLGGDLARRGLLASLGARVRLHVQQVDDPADLVLDADREMHRDAAGRERVPQLLEDAVEVGPLAVEHVHEEDAGQAELLRPRPDAVGLDLDAHDRRDDDQRSFDDPQRRDRVALEARLAGRVDQVDLPALPLEVAEGRGDRHLPALLVLVPVGDSRALLDRSEPVDRPGLEEHCLDERGLPRPTVSGDGDVADLSGLDCGHAYRSSSESY